MVTSGGGLAAQNILDSAESHRSELVIIGLDASGEHPRITQYDNAYIVPLTSEKRAFEKRLKDLIELEKPDIVLPAADHDVQFLSFFKEQHPKYAHLIPCGTQEMAVIIYDKWLSYQFATENKLPFVRTYLPENNYLKEFNNHFPVIIKPRQGYGSHGVRFVFNFEQLQNSIGEQGVVIQDYIGDATPLYEATRSLNKGLPIFFSVPEKQQYAIQTIIRPDGTWVPPFCSINTMVMGKCEESSKIDNNELTKIANAFSNAFSIHGWRGSLNIQLKPNNQFQYLAFEFNGRVTGSTSARYLMGFDEIGLLVSSFCNKSFRKGGTRNQKTVNKVWRTLTDAPNTQEKHACLLKDGFFKTV